MVPLVQISTVNTWTAPAFQVLLACPCCGGLGPATGHISFLLGLNCEEAVLHCQVVLAFCHSCEKFPGALFIRKGDRSTRSSLKQVLGRWPQLYRVVCKCAGSPFGACSSCMKLAHPCLEMKCHPHTVVCGGYCQLSKRLGRCGP